MPVRTRRPATTATRSRSRARRATNHTIQGSFVDNKTEQMDLRQHQRRACRSTPPSWSTRQTAEQAVRHQLQRRARLACVRDRAVFAGRTSASAMRAAPARRWPIRRSAPAASPPGRPTGQHYHAPFFSALDPEDRNNKQYRRQRQLLPHDARHGQPQPEGRRRALHVEPPRRQLAERHQLRLPVRLPDHGRYDRRSMPQGRLIPLFVPGRVPACRTGCRRSAPRWTSRRLSFYAAGSLGRVRSLLVRPRHALRKARQRGDGRHHRRRHAQPSCRASA